MTGWTPQCLVNAVSHGTLWMVSMWKELMQWSQHVLHNRGVQVEAVYGLWGIFSRGITVVNGNLVA